ncbi:cobalamin-dependent protein, partial [Candidatus Sumerlaeota bacterium]|nr:cobalamin-dependent protein [Candidatus Sumerlaeota bacterium]
MKICLISPYESVAAYGLRILSSVLKRDGHAVEMIFLPLDFHDSIPPKALEQTVERAVSSSLVGVSLSSNYMRLSIDITRAVKERNPNVPVLWGGIHPTIEPIECLDFCDIACVGEAEDAFSELARKMDAGKPYADTLNFYFKLPDGSIVSNPVRALDPDIDKIPFPDYSGEGHFILNDGCIVPVTHELLDKNLMGQYLT